MQLFLFCLSVVAYCTALPANAPLPYYWRDYTGAIPNDAVTAGLTKDNKKIYVGQGLAYHKSIYGDIPGSFVQLPMQVVLDGIVEVDDHVRILCSNAHQNTKWVRTDSTSFQSDIAKKQHPIVGGLQKNIDGKHPTELLWVGRTIHANEKLVGKIYVVNQTHVALDYAQDKHRFTAIHFEALVLV